MAYKQDSTTGKDINQLGPNQYLLNYTQKEITLSTKFGSKARFNLENQPDVPAAVPGPGQYEIPKERPNTSSTRGTMGFGKREDLYKYQLSCNPDQQRDYMVDLHTIEYKSNKIREFAVTKNTARPSSDNAQRITSDNTSSGPGTENIGFNGTKINAPKWVFGIGQRPPLNGVPQFDVGPGQYFNETTNP